MRPIFTVITDPSALAFGLKPNRSVQSYVEIGLLPLEDSGSSIAANHTFHR